MAAPDDELEVRTIINRATPEPAPGARDRACLIVVRGINAGELYRLTRPEVLIGRGHLADVEVPDDGVSRRHARVRLDGDGVLVEDLGSRNGTYVNGERITAAVRLAEGDKIQLSTTTLLKFTYVDGVDESFQRRMYETALRDALTQAFNRKYFLDRLEREVRFARRHAQPLTLVGFDVDRFREVNERFGHDAGDYVLSALAGHVQAAVRSEDVVARTGGGEFAVLCRATDVPGATIFAERLRAGVETFQFVHDNDVIAVTISVGVAGLPPGHDDGAALLAAAAHALDLAKRGGRNRCHVAAAPGEAAGG